jgi:hypothetical protein
MKRFVLTITRSSSTNKASQSFHKRPLPTTLTALSSSQGKVLFKEALASDGMESYFPLAEQFVTQSEPSFCSLSSLSMVLNALNFDPKKVWKGLWRWVSEETLQCESTRICGHSLDRIKTDGLSFVEFESLARCHGVKITSHRVIRDADGTIYDETSPDGLEAFRSLVERISSDDRAETFIVVNYSRKILGQTGDGHFSPIGGYHKEKELVLIMDVARFKYPPYWVPLQQLWEAMAEQDSQTHQPRGYFVVSGWNTKQQLQEQESDVSQLLAQAQDPNSNHNHSHGHGHAHAHDHHGHCITVPEPHSRLAQTGSYNSSSSQNGAVNGGLHHRQRSTEHSRLTSATAFATIGSYVDNVSVTGGVASVIGPGAHVCTHDHDHSHSHGHHHHSYDGHVLHHVSSTIAAPKAPAAPLPPVQVTAPLPPVPVPVPVAVPVAATPPAVQPQSQTQVSDASPTSSPTDSSGTTSTSATPSSSGNSAARQEAVKIAAAVAEAMCPPMIRTWQDFKRYVPRNMCQSRATAPAAATRTGTGDADQDVDRVPTAGTSGAEVTPFRPGTGTGTGASGTRCS